MAKELNKKGNRTEKIKKKNITHQGHLPARPAHLAAHWPAQHCAGPCQPPASSRQAGREEHAGARAGATPPGCLPASPGHRDASRLLLGAAPTPWTPSLSSSPSFPSSVSFSHAPPNTPTAAVRRCRNHRRPDDAPSRSRAPAPRHQPPHRATRPKEPRSAAPMFSPSSATEDRRRQIRRRSSFPELAVHPTVIYVSL